jgi:hypothetical protein
VPAFLITIDTEGDNIWSSPDRITTRNATFLPRFQALCEKYGLRPTWLTNYEMAISDEFADFGRDVLRRQTAEIGMHLHAWNSPPVGMEGRAGGMPYLIEFSEKVIVEKVRFMTGLLEEMFGVKMVSHRAGRWAFNETYAKVLLDNGYTVDCSVTPHVSWRETKGFPDGAGGTDYRGFPTEPYFVDPSDITSPGKSSLLEVPMTIARDQSRAGELARAVSRSLPRPVGRAANRLYPAVSWFRPNGRNLAAMRRLLRERRQTAYIEFMLHSSELMPGGSPTFRTERSIELLYDQLEQLFEEARRHYHGATLGEFRKQFEAAERAAA